MEKHPISTTKLKNLASCIRILSADAIQKANSGHPGMPLGMADFMTVLMFHFLKFNSSDPKWLGRDRFVLSAGHGSMLLYSILYLTGYDNFGIDEIKNFRQMGSKAAGHPEYGAHPAIETTTGPLGQGIANAVGMAIAAKKNQVELGALSDYKIYCLVGDGCLMEGISSEALSLAGHLKLDNLVILFDDNGISIDGSTNLTRSEDIPNKYASMGFDVYSVDGHDYQAIYNVLENCSKSKLPKFISIKTEIGFASGEKAGTSDCHGAPLGLESINTLRKNLGWEIAEPFIIPDNLLHEWQEASTRNLEYYNYWQEGFKKFTLEHNYNDIDDNSILLKNIDTQVAKGLPQTEATRVSLTHFIKLILEYNKKAIVGSADLSVSNGIFTSNAKAITASDFSGNFIHYGVRENAMAAIMNGLAIENFLPIGGTFLVFSDYMRPSIRLSALMNLRVIYVFTHDSIGLGEDGPTHQPVEHLASLRAIPNLMVFRPADRNEVAAILSLTLKSKYPVAISLSRQSIPQVSKASFSEIAKGAYVLAQNYKENVNIKDCKIISIWATGSEVHLALDVMENLTEKNYKVRVISAPCLEAFLKQDRDYVAHLIGEKTKCFSVAIEAASKFGWERIIGNDGMFFGVNEFGHSAPAKVLYNTFGLTVENISNKIQESYNV